MRLNQHQHNAWNNEVLSTLKVLEMGLLNGNEIEFGG
jgi:hypothetical protein